MFEMEINLKGLPKTANGSHGHWHAMAKQKKTWKINASNAAIKAGLPEAPLTKAKITCTRHSTTECDFDNLVISFKPLIDGLKLAGVISDDKSSVIGQPTYLWVRAKRNEGFVTIKVEAA